MKLNQLNLQPDNPKGRRQWKNLWAGGRIAILFASLLLLHSARGQTPLLTTFTNPTPAVNDRFGASVAVLGSDRVIVGASGAGPLSTGEAYLFNTNGQLLTTFTNPTPALNEYFGSSVAALGSDRIIVGAPYDDSVAPGSGSVYLFNTNGGLVMTINNPAPATNDLFGLSVAAFGNDRVLIGASLDDVGATDTGAAYLFSTNGTLLATFTNPPPVFGNVNFGRAVAAVGTDRVLVGKTGGAYLFSTNGTLVSSFNNPSPSFNNFGNPVAGVGPNRVLIGAIFEPTGAADAGAAFLFNTNGALITTFTNPTPEMSEYFGSSLAAVGTDRVMIGAVFENTGAADSGSAYLFNTNGTLLATITNPAPEIAAYFARSLAVFGTERVLIGSDGKDTGALDAGVAYLFSLPSGPGPSLTVQLTATNSVMVSWPSPSPNFTLQQNTNGLGTVNWSNILSGVQDNGTIKYIIINPPAGNRFYRLIKP